MLVVLARLRLWFSLVGARVGWHNQGVVERGLGCRTLSFNLGATWCGLGRAMMVRKTERAIETVGDRDSWRFSGNWPHNPEIR